ncbi:hypothetical protein ANCDUO_11130 [Ancylostoma duodenale]|uniref:Uncharacterized protein n=1 Tax=Ancylostoma duodenale TaxID=51022 RepID=A0A0C2GNT9_9BILA|nr:hypothetical protein ANCDUO_11130 [Ancylostoma duodenale]
MFKFTVVAFAVIGASQAIFFGSSGGGGGCGCAPPAPPPSPSYSAPPLASPPVGNSYAGK